MGPVLELMCLVHVEEEDKTDSGRFLWTLSLHSTFPAPQSCEPCCPPDDMVVPRSDCAVEQSRVTQTVNYSSAKWPSINYLA